MPAIQPERLKTQIADVVRQFAQPEHFVRALKELFEFYADHTRKPGQVGAPPPLIPSFKIPSPVLRQVLQTLGDQIAVDPHGAIELVDALWAEPYLECRLLGSRILGEITPSPPAMIVDRLVRWATPQQEARLLSVLMTESAARLRVEAQDDYQRMVLGWLKDKEKGTQTVGLQALPPLIEDPKFSNLPFIFQAIGPLVQHAPSELRPDLLAIVRALARRSPQETAYFLRNALHGALDPTAAWLIRQTIDLFPPEMQAGLRAAAREKSS